jgi:hypothetical protein
MSNTFNRTVPQKFLPDELQATTAAPQVLSTVDTYVNQLSITNVGLNPDTFVLEDGDGFILAGGAAPFPPGFTTVIVWPEGQLCKGGLTMSSGTDGSFHYGIIATRTGL